MLQTDLVYKYISPEPEQLQTCWENIKDTVKSLGGARVKYSDLEHTICTPKTISYLAYTGSISVIGNYQHFYPRREHRAQTPIIIDEKFSLSQLADNGQIFRRTDWDDTSVALAWYQGYLHLFKSGPNGWYPLTKIGHEEENGPFILMYMLGINPNVWDSDHHLSLRINNKLSELKDAREFKHYYHRQWDTAYPHKLGKQLNLAKLQASVPRGTISSTA
ncbi:Bgt-20263 [Blumeria graminis f. sp. tritici]|uniref:Bgt-20263 n=1 Tax=Blumeria graminis f. sp. tritici TaxID=62690 RepID=A0A9X9QFL6_BLUGR|nr:Bgt-20263 [Blumeria graminis f. sp. tritici]